MSSPATPQLRLEDFFYPEVTVRADPSFKGGAVEASVLSNILLMPQNDRNDKVNMQMRVQVKKNGENAVVPYEIEMTVVGSFSITDAPSPEKALELVARNGSAMLYSSARDFVMSITGRGPWSRYMLPTMDPRALLKDAKIAAVGRETKKEGEHIEKDTRKRPKKQTTK